MRNQPRNRGACTARVSQFRLVLRHALPVRLALAVQERSGPKLAAFVLELPSEPGVSALRERVQAFARRFPMPGEEGTDSFRP